MHTHRLWKLFAFDLCVDGAAAQAGDAADITNAQKALAEVGKQGLIAYCGGVLVMCLVHSPMVWHGRIWTKQMRLWERQPQNKAGKMGTLRPDPGERQAPGRRLERLINTDGHANG